MKKRTFIKLSSALMTAPIIAPFANWLPGEKIKNWAGNLEYSTDRLYAAASIEDVAAIVKKYEKIKVLGTRHCFNRIADSRDNFISLKQLTDISIDEKAKTVTVDAGINYGQLCPVLQQKGYALHNLASLPHISVAGACTTATHGSGVGNGNLSTAVRAIELVTADGKTHTLHADKDGERFNAAVVGLGALGVITRVTLGIHPTFDMTQHVFLKLPMQQLVRHFDAIMSAGYSVSLFTDWQSSEINEVWIKSKVGDNQHPAIGDHFFGAVAATRNLHPIAELSAENCTPQMGVAGPWYERLPHFKMGFTPSSGVELQSEYFVPHTHAVEAIQAVTKLGKQIGPHLFISEIRTINSDNLWMSPCYKQSSVTIHFTWKQDWPAVQKLLPIIEKALQPYHARPHWGKLFTMPAAQLASMYEKLPAFRNIVKEYDPSGKFRNDFVNTYVFGGSA